MKPVTVRAGTVGEVTPLQQEGLDRVVDYLVNSLKPSTASPLLPDTGRIIIEWGDEGKLETLREDG